MRGGSPRPLSLGCPVSYGASAVSRRLEAFGRHWPLHGRRLLDVGCGNGAYTIILGADFDEVHAIDIEPQRLAEFQTRVDGVAKYTVRVGSAEQLTFPDNYFDVVSAIEVIEHIVDLDSALSEIHRVLRPGGALLVSCPNRLFPIETHTFVVGRGREHPARYLPFLPWIVPLHRRLSTARSFTTRHLGRIVSPKGFRVVAYDWIMPPLDHLTLGRRPLRWALDRLETSVFRVFGVSIIAVFEKRS